MRIDEQTTRTEGDARSEATWVERARGGDRAAFHDLYRRHHRRVYALALRLTASREDAEEVTQDTFVNAWRRLAGYRGEGAFSTWLHGIALRLCRERWRTGLRRRRRHRRYALEMQGRATQALETQAREAQALEGYAGAVVAALPGARLDLETAIAALPARMRATVVLHLVEGHSQAETARLMGVTEGTVKTHVHRARAALQERLGSPPASSTASTNPSPNPTPEAGTD